MMDFAQRLNFDSCDIEDEELNISCRTTSSGCDVDDPLNSSTEEYPISPQPRKLSFSNMDCSDSENNSPDVNDKTPAIIVTG